jgi:hypothetical protein
MSVKLSLWGTNGRINVDRQEIQIYLRSPDQTGEDLRQGWNVRYTTELTKPVWFYVRGEEYSAQIDHFVQCIKNAAAPLSDFRTASDTGLVAAMMRADANRPLTQVALQQAGATDTTVSRDSIRAANRSILKTLLGRFGATGRAPRDRSA